MCAKNRPGKFRTAGPSLTHAIIATQPAQLQQLQQPFSQRLEEDGLLLKRTYEYPPHKKPGITDHKAEHKLNDQRAENVREANKSSTQTPS